jgi:hypothetical protein
MEDEKEEYMSKKEVLKLDKTSIKEE